MNKLLTIVVPVYKVEPYINKCLDSCVLADEKLMSQLEVIIVNDGTPDNSAEMSREYVKRYPQTFRQIDKENGGHGSTINTSLKAANGKYYKLVDSDDWVEKDGMIKLVHALGKTDADLVLNPFYEVENDLPITFKNQDQAYNPHASFYVPENGFAQETEYTVIALYRQQDQWVSSPTSFTPNTVFVPEKSVTCRMVGGEQGVWLSTILRNGTIEKLEKKLAEQGLSGTVTYYDQGYSEIRENLSSYYRIAQIVLLTGLALWGVVLAVFLALFPLQRGKDARRMWTLGVPQKRIFLHIWGSDLFLCIIGTILALAVSLSAMGWAMRQLQGLSRTNLELDVAPGQTVVLCLAALALETAILAVCAVRVAKKAGGQS